MTLDASDGAANDYFGASTSIHGGVVVVGAHSKASSSGAAYVFTRNSHTGNWEEKAKLEAWTGTGTQFGYMVVTAEEGDIIGVGAPRWYSNEGCIFTFMRTGTDVLTSEYSAAFVMTSPRVSVLSHVSLLLVQHSTSCMHGPPQSIMTFQSRSFYME